MDLKNQTSVSENDVSEMENDFSGIIKKLQKLSDKLDAREQRRINNPYFSATIDYLRDLLIHDPTLENLKAKFNDLLIDCIAEDKVPQKTKEEFDTLVAGIQTKLYDNWLKVPHNNKGDNDSLLVEVEKERIRREELEVERDYVENQGVW